MEKYEIILITPIVIMVVYITLQIAWVIIQIIKGR